MKWSLWRQSYRAASADVLVKDFGRLKGLVRGLRRAGYFS